MTKDEFLANLALRTAESAAEWAEAIAYEALTGELKRLTDVAEECARAYKFALEQAMKNPLMPPDVRFNLGGAKVLEEQRGSPANTGPAALALVALETYAAEAHDEPDIAAGIRNRRRCWRGGSTRKVKTQRPAQAAVDVAGAGAPEEGADVAAGEGEVADP